MNAITERKIGDYTLRVYYDEDPCNPREDYDHETIIYSNHRRYNPDGHKIDEIFGEDDRLDREFVRDHYMLKIYAHIHSGISLSTTPFSDAWDSGLFGIIAIPKSTFDSKEKAEKFMEGEIQELQQYYDGEIWCWRVFDKEGDEVDSCYNYYDEKQAESEAEDVINSIIRQKERELEEMWVAVRDAVDELCGKMFCDGKVLVTVSETPQKYEFFAQNIKDGEVQQPAHAVGVEYLHREILEPMVKSLANN